MRKLLFNLDSDSLGDTICIMPCIDYLTEKSNDEIHIRIKPFFQTLFKESYPNVKYFDENISYDKEVIIYYDHTKPMQTGFAEQMGIMDWKYIRPKIDLPKGENPFKKKYITSGIHSTFQMKYWNDPMGGKFKTVSPYWSQLFKMIKKDNYIPVVVEKDEMFGIEPYRNGLPSNCVKKINTPLDETMIYIYHSEFFIGLSSGLSWLAHALGKPVVMISNFTEEWHEMDINTEDYIRITNKSVCNGCWNKKNWGRGDTFINWDFCPEHKDTPRQFECHYSITPDYVYNKIKHLLK
jgi:autotransporter strand-loop-strand O-heptosyltransferase